MVEMHHPLFSGYDSSPEPEFWRAEIYISLFARKCWVHQSFVLEMYSMGSQH